MITPTASVIDNLKFNYLHWADDFVPGDTGGANLRRFIHTRNWTIGSLAPGSFLNVDLKMKLGMDTISDPNDLPANELFASIYLFDPARLEDVRLLRVSASQLLPVQRSIIRDALLYDAQMQLVTTDYTPPWGGAKYVKLTMQSGVEFLFEVVKANSDPNPRRLDGRFIQTKDPNGTTHNITYKTWTQQQIDESPTRLWQINQLTDAFNRTMTFSYHPNQIGGRWCVSQVALPDATQVSYAYAGNYLQSVSHADGTTTSITYSSPPNAPNDIVRMDIFDPVADAGHRKKAVLLSGSVQVVDNTVVPVSVDHIRGMVNGAGEISYIDFLSSVNGFDLVHVYEGGGRMKRVIDYMNKAAYLLDGWSVANSYDVTGTVENEYAENEIDFYRTKTQRDETGVETQYKYDEQSRLIYVIYDDDTFESNCYGQHANVTRQRDREGNVAKSVYDANGNRTSQQVGLRDHSSNSGATFDPVTGLPIYDRCATNDVQTAENSQLSWQYDSLGRVTAEVDANGKQTDYAYDSTGKLLSVTLPPDTPGGARAQTSFTYNSVGRKITETDPTGNITQFFYNSIGRLTKTQYPDSTTEETVYGTTGNAIGLPIKQIDRRGVVTQLEYDSAERLVTKIHAAAVMQGTTEVPTPEISMTETWTYLHGTNDPLEHRQAGALRKFVYDYRGRVVKSKSYPRSGKELVSKSTYVDNRVFSAEDPYGRKTYFAYDATDGRLIRTIQGTVPSYSLANFAAVLAATRNTISNATFIVNDSVFTASGELDWQIDPRNFETRFEYDSRGRRTNQRAAYGTSVEARTETLYDAASNVTEVRSPRYFDSSDTEGYNSARETWTYNGRGKVATHTEAPGSSVAATESFTYDLKGRQSTHTDFGGNVWTLVYDSCCVKSVASKNPLGHGNIRNADSNGRVVHTATVSTVDSHVADMLSPVNSLTLGETTTQYDGRGRPIAQTIWLTARNAIDPSNPPIAGWNGVSTSDGLTTQYLYDDNLADTTGLSSSTGVTVNKLSGSGSYNVSLSNAISKLAATQANGGAGISFSSDAPGRATVVINGEEEISFTITDGADRTVMSGQLDNYKGTQNALLAWSTQLHDTVTNVSGYGDCLETKSIDALGKATGSLVDGAGRTMRTIDQLSYNINVTYDAAGNQLTIRDPNNVGTDMLYDQLNRNTSRTDTSGDTTSTQYNKSGSATRQTDGKGLHTYITFDARGRQKLTADRNSAGTVFTYTARGQLASLQDAEAETTSYTYDSAGGKLTETYPDHTGGTPGQSTYGKVTFTLDAAGRLKTKQDQLGDTCTFNYDLAGRMTQRDYRTAANSPSGTIADNDTFTFDKASRALTAVSGRYTNTVTYTYDNAGRKKTEALTISGQTYTTTTAYNAKGQLTSYTYPDSTSVARSYTDRGELYQLTHASTVIDTRTYDNGGRMTGSSYNNGVSESRSYNADNTLASISFSGASIGNLSYTWDDNKNKLSESITGTMSNYGFTIPSGGYDNEDRLVSYNRTAGLAQSCNLSPVGDWWSVTTNGTVQDRVHGPTHELLNAGAGQNVSTDVKGNITLIPAALRPNSTSLLLNWDFDNRLSSADVGNNSSIDVTYKFDALGRRVFRDDGTTATVYVQSGQQTIADYTSGTAASSPIYRYIYASYIDEPVLRYKPSNSEALYFHRNQQYSITAITNSSATIVERYAYSGYGVPSFFDGSGSSISSSSINNRYTYTGREWDSAVLLYHFRARMYDGSLGRFSSRDPIEYEDGLSLYRSYFGIRHLDPSGLGFVIVPIETDDEGHPTPKFGFGPSGGIPGQPHNPGGPLELPDGEENRCKGDDTCFALAQKIQNFILVIQSHNIWDIMHPDPRWPNGRHFDEIHDLVNGLNRCYSLYGSNCRNPKCPPCVKPVPVPDTITCQLRLKPETVDVCLWTATGYACYRVVRMIPSIFCPPTAVPNLICP